MLADTQKLESFEVSTGGTGYTAENGRLPIRAYRRHTVGMPGPGVLWLESPGSAEVDDYELAQVLERAGTALVEMAGRLLSGMPIEKVIAG